MSELMVEAVRGAAVPAWSAGAAHASGRSAAARLLLDEGRLETPDGGSTALLDERDRLAIRASAQRISERALADLGSAYALDATVRLARLVAAVSKLDVYLDVHAYLRAEALVERATARVGARSLAWHADDAALARAVLAATSGVRGRVVGRAAQRAGAGEAALAWLKRSRWEWTARGVVGVAESLRQRRVPPGAATVLATFDVRNAGMVANVALLASELGRRGLSLAGVYMDRRVGAEARRGVADVSMAPLASFGAPGDVADAVARGARVHGAIERWKPSTGDGDAERRAAAFAFGRLHLGYVVQTLIDLRASERLLDRLRPRVVVVASDAHRYARMLVLLARGRGIASVVVQHGALAYEDFYVPLVADRMLAWGPWCRDWFAARGAAAHAVHDVGFLRGPARRPLRAPLDAVATRALFAAQPVPDHVTHALLEVIREALALDGGIRLGLRPHPGEGRRAVLAAELATWPVALRERVTVSPPGRALADDLAACDVVMSSQSTVGIDALAAGVPVLELAHPDVEEPIPFRAFGAVVGAVTAAEIVAGVAALRDPAALERLAAGADAFLDAYVGRSGAAALAAAAAVVGGLVASPAGLGAP